MSLQQISNLCQTIEDRTPTVKKTRIAQNLSSFEDKSIVIKILSLEYKNNNMGSKKSVKWVADALGLFEEEIEYEMNCWGDLGEALDVLYEGQNESCNISLKEMLTLLEMDCASHSSPSYILFREALNKMNALGGYYTDPASSARRRTARIAKMIERQKLGKKISLKNLAKLQAQEKAQREMQEKATKAMVPRLQLQS